MFKRIAGELREHLPFTIVGAASGIAIMLVLVLTDTPARISQTIFSTLHPLHVVLSALATTAMYRKYGGQGVWAAVIIGYVGSIGVASLSDAIIPYFGGVLLGIEIEFHLPFIDGEIVPYFGVPGWILVNTAALLGIVVGVIRPSTRLPHMGHVLLSTWASMFYFTAFGIAAWLPLLLVIFLFLFVAVWIPCCVSDIAFPLMFTKGKLPPHDI